MTDKANPTMPQGDIAISVRNLSKNYRLFKHPGDRIKQFLSLGLKHYHRDFTALSDISFDIKRGETVGIVGCNGSGKSTLLQLVCGVLTPSSGTVQVNGRICALLELGAGFNSEFTGRENVYFQSALLGLTKEEIDRRFDKIAEFADIGEYLDQPVRTYSSGMFVRLAFAVSVHADPDILVVDEALSVGDAAFQHKSIQRSLKLIQGGSSLLLVSHDRSLITSTCDQCLLLDKGKLVMRGHPAEVFDFYYASVTKGSDSISLNQLESGHYQIVSGTGEATVKTIRILGEHEEEIAYLAVGSTFTIEFNVQVKRPLPHLALVFEIKDRQGQAIFSANSNYFSKSLKNVHPRTNFKFSFKLSANLGPGTYSISTYLVSTHDRFSDNFETKELALFFEARNTSHHPFIGHAWLNPELEVCET